MRKAILPILALSSLLTALLFLKSPGQFLHPQFWAEGSYLYSYAFLTPKFEFLFQEVSGYLLLTQRIIVLLVSKVGPAKYHPALCVMTSVLLFVSLLTYFSLTPSRLPLTISFVIGVILSPHFGSEVHAKLLYLMWTLPVAFLFVLFRKSEAITPKLLLGDLVWIIIAGLSGPVVFLFVPPLVYVFLKKRNRYYLYTLSAVLSCALLQAYYLLNHPQSAIATAANSNIFKDSISVLLSNYLPQYFFIEWIPSPEIGISLLLLIALLTLSLKTRSRTEVTILALLFFSSAIPPLLKLFPHANYFLNPLASNSSRYFFFPYLSLTFYLLLIVLRGAMWGRAAALIALSLAFINHLPGFQAQSMDYRWSEHLELAEQRNCYARIPIPYTGNDGIAWAYHKNPESNEICSDRKLNNWQGGSSERVRATSKEQLELSSLASNGIVSVPPIRVSKNDSFVNFSARLLVKPLTNSEFGIKFFDSKNKVIKDVRDLLYHSIETSSVAEIPKDTAYFRPYIRIRGGAKILLSRASVLIF